RPNRISKNVSYAAINEPQRSPATNPLRITSAPLTDPSANPPHSRDATRKLPCAIAVTREITAATDNAATDFESESESGIAAVGSVAVVAAAEAEAETVDCCLWSRSTI